MSIQALRDELTAYNDQNGSAWSVEPTHRYFSLYKGGRLVYFGTLAQCRECFLMNIDEI